MLIFALVTLIAPGVFANRERRSSHGRQQTLKSFGSEFLDGVQGLPTLKAFGQSAAYARRLAERARELCDSSLRVISMGVMTRGITDCGVAIGAASALALAVWNLLDNAVKYSPDCQTVWVELAREDGRVAIRVKDKGMGIPFREQKRIFRKFVRGKQPAEKHIKGTGIGLAIARRIVEAHHGEIRLRSEPGQGSTFAILLPPEQNA